MTEVRGSRRSTRYFLLRNFTSGRFVLLLALGISLAVLAACGLKPESRGVPMEVEAAIASVSDDIAAERYEKIYNEADDLWKQELDLDKTVSVFKTLRTKLGKMVNRELHSAKEQENSGGPLQGRVFIVSYRTRFEKGEGMETFTLVERDHQWRLARYFVNSTALK
ncbi:MAG TPA: DUF4019 domain-containing protein [Pyrinomonadaceae bacterium]|nr:DUF4019 domain-containing protein [Pyrinomonadaceae bacterium]